jgi:hypothetical protein
MDHLEPVLGSHREPTSDPQVLIGQIEGFLKQAILQMPPDPQQGGRGRPRVLPSLCLWAGLLVCLLRGFSSQLALWRLLHQADFWFQPRRPVSDEAVYKRLEKEGAGPLQQLFTQISAVLQTRLAPYAQLSLAPFAKQVVALDETTLDQVARSLPALRQVPNGDDRLLPGKMAGLFDLRRQQWLRLDYIEKVHQNGKVLARAMIEGIEQGSLILADLGYFGFEWFDDLTDAKHWWVSRLRQKTSTKVIHTFYHQGETFDGLVWLGAYRADQAAHAVRLVQFKVGQTLYRYITNVRDPQLLPMIEIARLYARRWDIELAFKMIKQHLGLHLLWSAKTVVLLQQVWAVLIIAQILQALQMEIAGRAEVDPFEVSLALMVEYLPQFAYTGQDPVKLFVAQGRQLGFIRPSRRTVIKAPLIPLHELMPAPQGLVLKRTPRYAQRKCSPQQNK